MLDPWDGPRPLTRAWCLWELYVAVHSATPIDVALSPAQAASFRAALVEDFSSIAARLCRVDARSATAYKGSDLEMIMGAIHENLKGGFSELNTVITTLLRQWLAACGRRELAALPPDARALHPLQNQVANLLADVGDTAGARALYEEALAARRARLGPRHEDTLASANNLSAVLMKTGDAADLAEAEALVREVVEGYSALHGRGGVETLGILHNLALVMTRKGKRAGPQAIAQLII